MSRIPSGWLDIGSDVNWEDYGGLWAKKGPDGAWYVVRFTNMYDAVGEKDCRTTDTEQYLVEVLCVDLRDITEDQMVRACDGLNADLFYREDLDGSWTFKTLRLRSDADETALVYGLVGYGTAAHLQRFSSDTGPVKLRMVAFRYAKEVMRNEDLREERLDHQVNQIGNTARDFGRGVYG